MEPAIENKSPDEEILHERLAEGRVLVNLI